MKRDGGQIECGGRGQIESGMRRPQQKGRKEEEEEVRGPSLSLGWVDRAICGEWSGPRGLLMPSRQQQNPFVGLRVPFF